MATKFITIPSLGGLITSAPADKISDRNASECVGIDFSLDGMAQTNKGYDLYGNRISTPGSCSRGFKYKKNFGTLKNIKMRVRDTGTEQIIEWYNNNNDYWEILKKGLATGKTLGWAPANGDGGSKVNKMIMGNGADNMMVWNGATGTVASSTSNSITINEVIASEGFDINGGKLMIGGNEYTYTGSSNSTFTGVTPDASSLVALQGVAQSVDSDILTEHILSKKTTIAFVHNQPSSNDTITDSANGFVTAGFTAGQKIAVTGSEVVTNNTVYTIKTVAAGTLTLSDNDVVTDELAGNIITIAAGCPKGNILLTSQRKLFLAGVPTNESKVYYSESGQVTSFGITSGLGSGGSFDLMEGGGPITLMESRGRNTILIHKTDAIIAYTRNNDGTNTIEDFETVSSGESVGATNILGEAFIDKNSYFISGIEGVKVITDIITSDGTKSLDVSSITDSIMPTISNYDFSTASVAYFPSKRVLLIACNDKDGKRITISMYVKRAQNGRYYDISIDPIPAKEFIVDGNHLYFVSAVDQNTYVMFDRFSANGVKIAHRWVSKEFTYDDPASTKDFNKLYIDGYMSELAKIKVTVLYGLLGEKGTKSETLTINTEGVSSQKVSALGSDILGETSIGVSNSNISNSYYFNIPLHFDIVRANRYKIIIESVYDTLESYDVESYWAINNIATNPTQIGIDQAKVINTNR